MILGHKLDLENHYLNNVEDKYIFYCDLISYANLLLERGDKADEVISMMMTYKQDGKIFKWLIDMARGRREYDEELMLIKEAIDYGKTKNYRGLIYEFKKMLGKYSRGKSSYEKKGD